MAASATAKPTKIGARRDDAPASDVVRRISSYGNTCGDSERYPKNSQNPCNLLIERATEPNRSQRSQALPRAARELPACCQSVARPGARAPPTHQPPKPDQWWESIPSP